MPDLSQPAGWLPLAFMGLMGAALLAYVVLDGYDLGVGILMRRADAGQRDRMVASIGPFWDANETWLVLGVGLLLVAFPKAHGVILGELYLPATLMLVGLVLRGVAFDFRTKAHAGHRPWWDRAFYAGSLLAAFAQGVMLGRYVTGFDDGLLAWGFAAFVGAAVVAGYALLGAGWLLMKTEGALQQRAAAWARGSLRLTLAGIAAISIATPLVSQRIFDKWFSFPNLLFLAPVPLLTVLLAALVWLALRHQPRTDDRFCWVPFAGTTGIFVLAFLGLAYSMLPYLVVDRLTAWQAAASTEALWVIFLGAVVVLPMIAAYSAWAYWIFRGKARDLSYS
mgnify:CR=1 FL=1